MKARTRIATIAVLLGAVVALAWTVPAARAESVLFDKAVKAGQLTCFPDLNNPLVYYYVNDKPHLGLDANGKPQFSFLRYVENVRSGANESEAREGEGGGIVHALVTLSVSPELVTEAQRELQRIKPGAKLVGPVVYKSGKFGLVSSFKDPSGNLTKQVVGLGNAPLLDGEKAAVSMQLTKLGAKILWESFQTPAPDISFSFEMDAEGYNAPHRALIEADFDQIYEHKAFGVGVASKYLAAEIKGAFDDLKRTGAIKLTQVGEDEKLDQLIMTAYNKIAEMMFSPVGGTGTPDLASLTGAGGQPSMLDRATTYLRENQRDARAENERIRAENRQRRAEQRREEARSNRARMAALASSSGEQEDAGSSDSMEELEPPIALGDTSDPTDEVTAAPQRSEEDVPAFAVLASFEMKSVHQQGHFTIDLNKYTTTTRTFPFAENIGDMRKLMKEGEHFRQVNLDDPLYKQRELVVFVDGMNAGDFGSYINFATVQLRKKHQLGEETQDEVRIDRKNFNSEGNAFKLLYGWKSDSDRRQWMNYEYQTTWSFFGGKEIQQPWTRASAGAIALAPPFQKRSVDLQADPDSIAQAGVRSITVKIFYGMGDAEKVKQVTLNAAKGQLSEKIDFILPVDKLDYDYQIDWILRGNKTVSTGRKSSNSAILYIDGVNAG